MMNGQKLGDEKENIPETQVKSEGKKKIPGVGLAHNRIAEWPRETRSNQ